MDDLLNAAERVLSDITQTLRVSSEDGESSGPRAITIAVDMDHLLQLAMAIKAVRRMKAVS